MGGCRGNEILLLYNKVAGRRRTVAKVDQLLAALRQRRFEVTCCESLAALQAARRAGPDPFRAVICAGGDGTLNAALNVLGKSAPLVPFPLGNENLLAKYLGIGSGIESMVELIDEGRVIDFDVADQGGHRFLLMLSAGFDAHVVQQVHRDRTSHVNKLTYLMQIATAMRTYTFPSLSVAVVDEAGEHRTLEGHWALVFNTPSYARGLGFAPGSNPTDGLLDLCLFQGGSVGRGLGHLATVMLRAHGSWSGCQLLRATRVQIESGESIPVQTDGDPSGHLPVDVHIVPQGVQLLVPSHHGRGDRRG